MIKIKRECPEDLYFSVAFASIKYPKDKIDIDIVTKAQSGDLVFRFSDHSSYIVDIESIVNDVIKYKEKYDRTKKDVKTKKTSTTSSTPEAQQGD